MSLSTVPAGPMSIILARLDRASMLRLSASCKSIRAAIAPEVELTLRAEASALHLANALLKEFAFWYRCSEINLQLGWRVVATGSAPYTMLQVFELHEDFSRDGENKLFAEVFADKRTHTISAAFRLHITSTFPLGMHRDLATRLEFKLDRTRRSGVCTGSVMVTDEKGLHAREANGAFLYTPVHEAYADGEVAVLRKLGVLMEK